LRCLLPCSCITDQLCSLPTWILVPKVETPVAHPMALEQTEAPSSMPSSLASRLAARAPESLTRAPRGRAMAANPDRQSRLEARLPPKRNIRKTQSLT
jgi:hypothetical protein